MSQIDQITEAVLVAVFPVSATNPKAQLRDVIRAAVASTVKDQT